MREIPACTDQMVAPSVARVGPCGCRWRLASWEETWMLGGAEQPGPTLVKRSEQLKMKSWVYAKEETGQNGISFSLCLASLGRRK